MAGRGDEPLNLSRLPAAVEGAPAIEVVDVLAAELAAMVHASQAVS